MAKMAAPRVGKGKSRDWQRRKQSHLQYRGPK